MGVRQSKTTPSPPTHDDAPFSLCSHTPPSSLLSSLSATEGRTFSVPKNVWTGKEGELSEAVTIDDLSLTLQAVRDQSRCLLKTAKTKKTIAVLLDQDDAVLVCAFTPPGGKYEGVPLFEWARIGSSSCRRGHRRRKPLPRQQSSSRSSPTEGQCNRKQPQRRHILSKSRPLGAGSTCEMTTPFDGTFTLQQISSSTGLASVQSERRLAIMLDGKTAALLEEETDAWVCHTCAGIDPAMMVCFVTVIDRLGHDYGCLSSLSSSSGKRVGEDHCPAQPVTTSSSGSVARHPNQFPITSFIEH